MTLETLQWFFNLLKTSAPVSLDCLAFLINYSNFIPGVESTFIAIINSNFFLKSRSMRSDTPYKRYSEPRMIPILYSYKKKNTRPYCDLRWSQLIFQSCLNWPIKKKKKTPKNCYKSQHVIKIKSPYTMLNLSTLCFHIFCSFY